jgi:hypothetical protein
MFAASRDEVIPREKAIVDARKAMLAIVFSGVTLITMNTLPSGVRFTQKYFIINILPDIVEARGRIFRRVRRENFLCLWAIPCLTMVAK